jgi:hypothetical protein
MADDIDTDLLRRALFGSFVPQTFGPNAYIAALMRSEERRPAWDKRKPKPKE